MYLPEALFPALLRVIHANKPFVSAQEAVERIRERELRPASFAPPKKLRQDVTVTVRRAGATSVYAVSPSSAKSAGHVIYAHGGGWVHEISPQHWTLVAQIAAEASTTVTVPIYSLLPHGNAEGANALVMDLFHAARVEHDDVRIAGDSAGGQIALSAALALRDQGHLGIRTVLISPALDLAMSNPTVSAVLLSDPWLGIDGVRVLAKRWAGNLSLTDPRVSPLAGDMHGLGPMLVLSGTRDIFNPDAHLLVSKVQAAGGEVTLVERMKAIHVFPLLPTRAAAAARTRVVDALRVDAGPG